MSYVYKEVKTIRKINNEPAKGTYEIYEKINGKVNKKIYDIIETSRGNLKYTSQSLSNKNRLRSPKGK